MHSSPLLDFLLFVFGVAGMFSETALGVVYTVLFSAVALAAYAVFVVPEYATWEVYYLVLTFITAVFMLVVYLASMSMNSGKPGSKVLGAGFLFWYYVTLFTGAVTEFSTLEGAATAVVPFLSVSYFWTAIFCVVLYIALFCIYWATKTEGPFRGKT